MRGKVSSRHEKPNWAGRFYLYTPKANLKAKAAIRCLCEDLFLSPVYFPLGRMVRCL